MRLCWRRAQDAGGCGAGDPDHERDGGRAMARALRLGQPQAGVPSDVPGTEGTLKPYTISSMFWALQKALSG